MRAPGVCTGGAAAPRLPRREATRWRRRRPGRGLAASANKRPFVLLPLRPLDHGDVGEPGGGKPAGAVDPADPLRQGGVVPVARLPMLTTTRPPERSTRRNSANTPPARRRCGWRRCTSRRRPTLWAGRWRRCRRRAKRASRPSSSACCSAWRIASTEKSTPMNEAPVRAATSSP